VRYLTVFKSYQSDATYPDYDRHKLLNNSHRYIPAFTGILYVTLMERGIKQVCFNGI